MSIIGNPIIVGKKPEQTKTVSPTTSQQVVTPDSGKVLSSVTVNAAPLQSKTVTPNKAGFTVSPDSGKYGLSSVKVNGNSNLVAGNIKSGVTIFGVTGTYNPVTSAIVISGLESTDTITCSGGGKSYSATWDTTDNRWEIVGLPLGTFTVTVTRGSTVKTKTVLIDIVGVYEIEFSLGLWLYNNGDECTKVTGGWVAYTESPHYVYMYTKLSIPKGNYYFGIDYIENSVNSNRADWKRILVDKTNIFDFTVVGNRTVYVGRSDVLTNGGVITIRIENSNSDSRYAYNTADHLEIHIQQSGYYDGTIKIYRLVIGETEAIVKSALGV